MKVEGHIEFSVIEQTAERAVSQMPVTAGIKNPYGTVHAEATLWFADVTATLLVMAGAGAAEGMKGFPLAINLNANLLGNQKEGVFKATATYVKRGRSVSVVRTAVEGQDGKLIAEVTTSHVLSQ
jgi:1,4-dihydroxy-2-naphthoyl-CoA hydrolase